MFGLHRDLRFVSWERNLSKFFETSFKLRPAVGTLLHGVLLEQELVGNNACCPHVSLLQIDIKY